MGRVNTPELNEVSKLALETGVQKGKSFAFRVRCQVILLKAAGRTSHDVGSITAMSYISVNTWVKRYKDFGIEGLKTKSGRGRKSKINLDEDKDSILEIIKKHRQRVQTAKAEWQEHSGKQVGLTTFKNFLKLLVEDINE